MNAPPFPAPLLASFSQCVEARAGLHFPPSRWADLERALRQVARRHGVDDLLAWVRDLRAAPPEDPRLDSLIGELTVGETYFFRDAEAFSILQNTAIPFLVAARDDSDRILRLWSAGCSTGEEAYSLAIAADQALAGHPGWTYRVIGADLNEEFLQKATRAVYSAWSFRATSPSLRERYFEPHDDRSYVVAPRIRERVSFLRANLTRADAPPPAGGPFDVVFCRNVLLYFAPAQTEKSLRILRDALREGGWLFTAATDAAPDRFEGFSAESLRNGIAYRKSSSQSAKFPRFAPPSHLLRSPVSFAPPPLPAISEREFPSEKLDALAHFRRARALEEKGALEEAAGALRQALYLDGRFIAAHFTLGEILRRQGRPEASRSLANARHLLENCPPETVLPGSDGITAGSLLKSLDAMMKSHG